MVTIYSEVTFNSPVRLPLESFGKVKNFLHIVLFVSNRIDLDKEVSSS